MATDGDRKILKFALCIFEIFIVLRADTEVYIKDRDHVCIYSNYIRNQPFKSTKIFQYTKQKSTLLSV